MKFPRVIIVMGVAGSGKSTVGAALANACGGKFFDADDFHPAANVAKMAAGQPLDDADRAPWLATLRREVIDAAPPGSVTVLACSALKKSYRDQLGVGSDRVALVYLEGDRETLTQRLHHRAGHYMKADMLASQLVTLEPPSDEEGLTLSIDAPVDEIVRAIRSAFGI
ncbi:MAG: gluconokinase [Verrucomicrobiota bacterium]